MSLVLPESDRCYFCDIVQGRSERWNVLAEDELTVTLLNGRQYETGQLMVVPLRHAPTLLDLDSNELSAVMAAAQRAGTILLRTYEPTGILLYQNNGVGSGQEVPHFHLHVVPRQPGSDWGFGPQHLSRLEKNGRSSRFDHTVVTAEKSTTAELLRRKFS